MRKICYFISLNFQFFKKCSTFTKKMLPIQMNLSTFNIFLIAVKPLMKNLTLNQIEKFKKLLIFFNFIMCRKLNYFFLRNNDKYFVWSCVNIPVRKRWSFSVFPYCQSTKYLISTNTIKFAIRNCLYSLRSRLEQIKCFETRWQTKKII